MGSHTVIVGGKVVTEEALRARMPKDADGEVDYDATLAMLPTKRTCDGCDLCCTALAVEEMNKPPGARCSMLVKGPHGSCGIYAHRPPTCKGYVCLWRAGEEFIPHEGLRPSDVGFVVSWDPMATPLACVNPDPARPQAWEAYHHVFYHVARVINMPVVIGSHDMGTAIFTPKGNLFRKRDYPEFFEGARIGVPSTELFDA